MDILIKSFNRPFYLDRCLASIYKFVEGDFLIKVLDDGTPEKYLEKIQKKYPKVQILLSQNSALKSEAIKENLKSRKKIDGFKIPTDLWIEAAKNATDYFIMTEDDVWFTEKLNLNEVVKQARNFNVNLLKLGWLGNLTNKANNKITKISENINATQPDKLFLKNELIMEAFFFNKYKFFTILYKLGKVDNETRNKYWALNSIMMGFYKKEYWLEIWKGMDGKVDEKRQLLNASVYYKKHQKNPNFISCLNIEVMKTTFQSSATNSYHEYGYDFDVNLFNHLINEAWLKGDFDELQNFSKDFTPDYFEQFVKDKIDVEEMRKWVSHFKDQYRNLGADVN